MAVTIFLPRPTISGSTSRRKRGFSPLVAMLSGWRFGSHTGENLNTVNTIASVRASPWAEEELLEVRQWCTRRLSTCKSTSSLTCKSAWTTCLRSWKWKSTGIYLLLHYLVMQVHATNQASRLVLFAIQFSPTISIVKITHMNITISLQVPPFTQYVLCRSVTLLGCIARARTIYGK